MALFRDWYGDPGARLLGLHAALNDAVHHITRMAEDEPYGVRGATIFLRLRDDRNGGGSHDLGTIAVDPTTVGAQSTYLFPASISI